MSPWVYSPHTGGKSIPPAVRARTQQRILDYANKQYAGKFIRIDVRFRGALCYIDAYMEPDTVGMSPPSGETREQWIERLRSVPLHLCRIRYFGDVERWSIAWYSYADEKYHPIVFGNGQDQGTPEEAFELAARYLQ